jgi:hypothetical protein
VSPSPVMPLYLGDVVVLKKPHACGANRWELVRLGADIKLKCQACGRLVMLPRDRVERRIRAFVERPQAPTGEKRD